MFHIFSNSIDLSPTFLNKKRQFGKHYKIFLFSPSLFWWDRKKGLGMIPGITLFLFKKVGHWSNLYGNHKISYSLSYWSISLRTLILQLVFQPYYLQKSGLGTTPTIISYQNENVYKFARQKERERLLNSQSTITHKDNTSSITQQCMHHANVYDYTDTQKF